MKKTAKGAILITILMFCLLICLSGCTKYGYVDGVKYTVIDDHAEVTGVDDKTMDAVIVPEFKGYPVTRISSSAFDQAVVESVTIPDSVTEIGYGAFKYSTLKSIIIPNSVTEIEAEAFAYCAGLESIVLPSGLTSISGTTFRQSALREIVIPEGVTTIDDLAFFECADLSEAVLPEGLEYIGYSAFSETGLKSIVIPESVTFVKSNAFSDCPHLKKAVMPPDADLMGSSDIFMNCTSLTEVELPEGMRYLPPSLFEGCTSLSCVTVPSTVSEVSVDAFCNCTALESVTFTVNEAPPEGFTLTILSAFEGCTSLRTVEVPAYTSFLDTPPQEICFILNSVSSMYPGMNCVFSDSLNIATVDLWDAVFSGELECSPYANGIDSFRLDVYNNTDHVLQVDCSGEPPRGMYLYSESGDCQNMLITALYPDESCLLDPGDCLSVGTSTACMNLHRDIPSGGDKYTLKFLEADSPLLKLTELFAANDCSYDVQQAAVWIITDNASFSDTQILTNSLSFQAIISMDEYDLAYSLVEQAKN